MKYELYEKALIEEGAEEIKYYSLINNFGFTYNYNGVKYDSRFVANCYGAVCNWWETSAIEREKEDEEFVKRIQERLTSIYNS